MMERLLTGEAPLAGCLTGRLQVRPFDFRAAARLLDIVDPIEALTAYGILGGVPLYLSFFRPDLSTRANILQEIATPTARLYVEPAAVFAAPTPPTTPRKRSRPPGDCTWGPSLVGYDPRNGPLSRATRTRPGAADRRSGTGRTRAADDRAARLARLPYAVPPDRQLLPLLVSVIEPNQGALEFGAAERVVDGIMAGLSDYMGLPFEALCRDWVRPGRRAAAAERGDARRSRRRQVGTWWNPTHEVDVVGLDAQRQVAVAGECKWRNQGFTWGDLQTYLAHVQALALEAPVRPDALHLLFSKAGFDQRVATWAAGTRARLLGPADLLAPF